MSSHDVKNHLQVSYVITLSATFYCNIINITFYRFAYLLLENGVHGPLIGCPRILQSEGHDGIAVDPQWCSEGGVLFVIRIHLDLIIS